MAAITLNSMYSRVIDQSALSTTEYTSAQFLEDAHVITQDIWSEVTKQRKGSFNWDIWYTDTVALQDEYTKPAVSSILVWAEYIETLSVNYDWLTYNQTGNTQFVKCNPATEEQIGNWEYYLENQPKTNPIYFERDKSVFIAPEPRTSEIWINRIKITWVRSIDSWNWTTSTTETQTKLPVQALETIVLWCIWKANVRNRRDRNICNDLRNEYKAEKQETIYKFDNQWTFINNFPN